MNKGHRGSPAPGQPWPGPGGRLCTPARPLRHRRRWQPCSQP